MEFKTTFRSLETHFIIIWVLVSTAGYIILSLFGHLDFRQYVFFLFLMAAAYAVLKNHSIFWFFLLFYILYLLLIRANFIHNATITKIDQVFSKAAHDVVLVMRDFGGK